MGQCLNMGVLGVCFASSGAQLALETGCCGWEGVLQEMPCPWGWGCVSCLAWETNVVWGNNQGLMLLKTQKATFSLVVLWLERFVKVICK